LNEFWRVNENEVSGVPGAVANSVAGLKQVNSGGLRAQSVQGTVLKSSGRK